MRYDGSQSIKNMEDVLLYGSTLEELKTKLETFLGFCKEKNLQLKSSKMNMERKWSLLVLQSEAKQWKMKM